MVSVVRPQCHGIAVDFFKEWLVCVLIIPALGMLVLLIRYRCSTEETSSARHTLSSNIRTLVFLSAISQAFITLLIPSSCQLLESMSHNVWICAHVLVSQRMFC